MNHQVPLVDGYHDLPHDFLLGFQHDLLINADVDSKTWWTALSTWTVHIMTVSSPCPPWSNASTGPGLKDPSGQLFPLSLLLCRILRPKILLLEQVNGFSSHQDRALCLQCLEMVGYSLRWKKVGQAGLGTATCAVPKVGQAELGTATCAVPKLVFSVTALRYVHVMILISFMFHLAQQLCARICANDFLGLTYPVDMLPFGESRGTTFSVFYHRSMAYRGERIGEAANPGPSQSKKPCAMTLAAINPTSLQNKHDAFRSLASTHRVHTFCCSETSATKAVQASFQRFMHGLKYRSIWSAPVPPHSSSYDEGTYRGKAAGVSMHTLFPARRSWNPHDVVWSHSVRLQHVVMRLGTLWIQVVVIYGYSNGNHQWRALTNELFQQAMVMTSKLNLPVLYVGDFNLDVHTLDAWESLRDQGYISIQQLFSQQHGYSMPPTCKNATSPDSLVMHPAIAKLAHNIRVLGPEWFDTHRPILIDFHVPLLHVTAPAIRYPQSWTQFGVGRPEIQAIVDGDSTLLHPVQDLSEWGARVESLVSKALASEAAANPQFQVPPNLPKRCRGRCQPAKIVKKQLHVACKPSRQGNHVPPIEPQSFQSRRILKQVRRVESLRQRIGKLVSFDTIWQRTWDQLYEEWNVICKQRLQGQPFTNWVQNIPELGPCPGNLPTVAWLLDLQQFLQHELARQLQQETNVQQQIRKLRHRNDVAENHAKECFAMIRGPKNPPFRTTETDLDQQAYVVPEGDQLWRLFLDKASDFIMEQPLFVDTLPAYLRSRDDFSLLVYIPTGTPEQIDTVRVHQVVYHFEDNTIAGQLTDYWKQFWLRDEPWQSVDSLPAIPDDSFVKRLRTFLPDIDWNGWENPHTLQNWRRAIKQLRSDSAPGVDGFAFFELKQLPDEVLQLLVDYVNTLDFFPDWEMIARTVPLAKKQSNLQAKDSRPITILGSIYRIWSKVTCGALTQHLLRHCPPQITGLLPKRGSHQASWKQQWALEVARHQGESLQGLTLDLTKCFNLIDRCKVCILLQLLRFPLQLIRVWFFSLNKLRRFWDLNGFYSNLMNSSTGCPEGDGWSVLIMVLLCLVWTQGLISSVPSIQASAYADNWSWWGSHEVHIPAARFTVECCAYFGLRIDWSKTWFWSTDNQWSNQLLHDLSQVANSPLLEVRRNAQDLGCNMTYQGAAVFGRMQDRFDRAKDRLVKLQHAPWPVSVKIHMIRMSVYPVAFYGVELLLVPVKVLDSLRSQIATAILGTGAKSANSAILFQCLHKGLLDPALHVTLLALKHAKQHLSDMSESQRSLFFHILSRHSRNFKVQGPASALREYLARLGVQCDREGYLFIGQFPKVSLLHDSMDTIGDLLEMEWQKDLLVLYTDRKYIGRQLPMDRKAILRLLRTKSPAEQLLLLREISGGFQPKHQQASWDHSTADVCEFCQEHEDTREHRMLSCSYFQEQRDPYMDILGDIAEHHSFLCHLPVPRFGVDAEFVALLHYAMPIPDLVPAVKESILRVSDGALPCFYTDGSSFGQDHPSVRFCAYSVVADLAASDSERIAAVHATSLQAPTPSTLSVVAVGRLKGRQQIHRAELSAIVWICSHFSQAIIRTDCAVAIDLIDKVRTSDSSLWVLHPDSDLLNQLQAVLSHGHQVLKIKAHQDPNTLLCPLEKYHAWGNIVADKAAVEANRTLFPDIAHHLHERLRQYMEDFDKFRKLYTFLVDLHQTRARAQQHQAVGNVTTPLVNLVNLAKQWRPTQIWQQPQQCDDSQLSSSSWGIQLMYVVHEWLRSCIWPDDEQASPAPYPVGIAWAEVAVALSLLYGSWLPVRRKSADGQEYLYQPRSLAEATAMGVTMGEQSRMASQMVAQYRSLINVEMLPDTKGGKVRALIMYGFSETIGGLKRRPAFEGQQQVCEVMAEYVRTNSVSLGSLIDIQFEPGFEIWPEATSVFQNPWNAHRREMLQVQKVMKAAKRAAV
eukprot:Skav220536  [mRNA]  locus=scaffold1629:218190:228022:+ [translate_table: standard]